MSFDPIPNMLSGILGGQKRALRSSNIFQGQGSEPLHAFFGPEEYG